MSKMAARMKLMKSMTEKVDHSSPMRTNIPAGLATPAPPLGSQLSTVISNLCATQYYDITVVYCFRDL